MMLSKVEMDILEALSPHTWQKGLDLVAQSVSERGIIYVHLARLEERDLIVSRKQGDERREYRLTEGGIRARHVQAAGGAMSGVFVPES